MVNPIQFIEVRGDKREILLTPSLYKIANDMDWAITGVSEKDIFPAYCKLFYCAAINKYEVDKYDNPELPDFDIKLIDVEIWATKYPKQFNEMILIAAQVLSGLTLKEIKALSEKKKNPVVGRLLAFLRRR